MKRGKPIAYGEEVDLPGIPARGDEDRETRTQVKRMWRDRRSVYLKLTEIESMLHWLGELQYPPRESVDEMKRVLLGIRQEAAGYVSLIVYGDRRLVGEADPGSSNNIG